MSDNRSIEQSRPEGWQEIAETDAFRSGIVVNEDAENAYKTVTVAAKDVGAMVLGPGHLAHLGYGDGPVGGAWPSIIVKGGVYDPQKQEIESTLLGMPTTTVIVPDNPGTVFQIIDACLTMVLTSEQMSSVSDLIRSMYQARAQQAQEDINLVEPTVLEEQILIAQRQGTIEGYLADNRGGDGPVVLSEQDLDGMPEGLQRLLRAILSQDDDKKEDDN